MNDRKIGPVPWQMFVISKLGGRDGGSQFEDIPGKNVRLYP
jgi:hypothetical protein